MTPSERARQLRNAREQGLITQAEEAEALEDEARKNPDSPFTAYLKSRARFLRHRRAT